jgi:hypothetical protein
LQRRRLPYFLLALGQPCAHNGCNQPSPAAISHTQ